MHYVLAALFIAHGIAHLVGLFGTWGIGELGHTSHKTSILAGHIDLGESGIRALGLWWLFCALGFVAAAILVLLGEHASFAAALASSAASAVLCLLFWPEARVGLVINLAIIVVVLFRPGVA